MSFTKIIVPIFFLIFIGCGSPMSSPIETDVNSFQITTEGTAFIREGGKEGARREAMSAAISEATAELKKKNRGSYSIADSKVVDEWQEGAVYHVQVITSLTDKPLCNGSYRKKIVATAFPVVVPDQIGGAESQDLYGGIPREIGNILMESGIFISRNSTGTVLYSRPELAPDAVNSDTGISSSIIDIARRQDAQFVLSGVIRDFKIESGEYVRGSGFFAELKSLTRDFVTRRSIGIDVFVHDGFTGALIFQHRYSDSIVGDISMPSGYTVGSERFRDTPAGHKITNITHQASQDIYQLLSCYPFATRVTQVVGDRIFIAAGSQDKVKVGDKFKIFPSVTGAYTTNGEVLESQGVLTITQVTSGGSQGTLNPEGKPFKIYPGDWVKSVFIQ